MKKIKTILIFILAFILLVPIQTFAAQQKPSTTYNFYFRELINTSGKYTDEVKMGTSKVSEGTSGSKAQKWFINYIEGKLYYKGTYQNVEYVFNGQFLDEEGNPVTFPIKTEYKEDTPVVDIYLYPQYDTTPLSFLNFNYIDNISTGSGSWANKGKTTNYTHTFKQPEDQEGYQFIFWQESDTGEIYNPEDTYFCDISSLEPGQTKTVNIHAIWQPSLIVNWYDEDELLETRESFEEDIQAYSLETEKKEGFNFLGWVDEQGNLIDENTIYSIPEKTTEKVGSKVINLYTYYEKEPEPEPEETPTPTPEIEEPTPTPTPTPEPEPEQKEKEEVIPTITPEPKKEDAAVPSKAPQEPVQNIPTTAPAVIIIQNPTQPEIITTQPTPLPTITPIVITNQEEEEEIKEEEKEEIKEEKELQTLEEGQTPLTVQEQTPYWALLNLLLTFGSVIISTILAIFYLFNKNNKEENEEKQQRRSIVKRLISIIITALMMFIFTITEDITLPMHFTDKYTILMEIIFIIHLIIALIWHKWLNKKEQNPEGEV